MRADSFSGFGYHKDLCLRILMGKQAEIDEMKTVLDELKEKIY
jgi:hypothetical protein